MKIIKVWLVTTNFSDSIWKLVEIPATKESVTCMGQPPEILYRAAEGADGYEAGDWLDEDAVAESKEAAIQKALTARRHNINRHMERIANELKSIGKINQLA
jgi:hypothetical protein